MMQIDRRRFLHLAGLGGVVFVSGCVTPGGAAPDSGDFHFVQLSDTHWGFEGPPNPDARGTLPKAITAVNALDPAPDFVIFTGDLTHTTDDPVERRRRMAEFRDIAAALRIGSVRFIPGEHDAALDDGAAYREYFGETRYSFDHKGVHFIALDNVSDPGARIGEAQLAWLKADLDRLSPEARIVVFTHRPLFDLAPQWDWATRDGAQAIDLLMSHPNVTVFYGHIHQTHHRLTGHIEHHAAKSLIFALPAPLSQPRRTPIAWDATAPYRGLGFREIEAQPPSATWRIAELGVPGA